MKFPITIFLIGGALLMPLTSSAQILIPGTSTSSKAAATSSAASSTSTAQTTQRYDEIRGNIEGVGEDILPIGVRGNDGELEVRRIRYGNKSAIKITRDNQPATLADLQPADAVVVQYSTSVKYTGTVASSTKPNLLAVNTNDGRTITFTPGANLEVKYLYSRNTKAQTYAIATGSSTVAIVPTLQPGTPVTVTVLGQSIVSIDAYSSGIIPNVSRDDQVIAISGLSGTKKGVIALLLILIAAAGALLYKKRKNRK